MSLWLLLCWLLPSFLLLAENSLSPVPAHLNLSSDSFLKELVIGAERLEKSMMLAAAPKMVLGGVLGGVMVASVATGGLETLNELAKRDVV